MSYPIARLTGLVVTELKGETLVYDLELNKAHCLNETAARVWAACSGNHAETEIAELISVGNGVKVTVDAVSLAIHQLSERNLVSFSDRCDRKPVSRRDLLCKLGQSAAIALPLISTVVVPKTAMAQSSVCGTPTSCNCIGRGSNGGTCPSNNCAFGCTCGDLTGCNPAGNHCRGICI